MYETYKQCVDALEKAKESGYRDFNSRIVNSEYPVLGVRTPAVKAIAKGAPISNRSDILGDFFSDKNKTHESVLLAGCLAARKGDYTETAALLREVVPLFGSWAHVDTVTPLLRWADKDTLLSDFEYLIRTDGQYCKRFFIMIMFSCCLDEKHIDDVISRLRTIEYGQYYVDTAAAWLIAEGVVKFPERFLPLLSGKLFPPFVHNTAIRKARESFRVETKTKEYLKTLKID